MLHRNKWVRIFLGVVALLAFGVFRGSPPAAAQTAFGEWSEPINLSRSGAATNPVMVEDPRDIIHVFWWDEFDGNMYSRLDGGEWSPPVPVSAPFGEYTPALVADSEGYLHAFWTDLDQVLHYANVSTDGISASAWNLWGLHAGSAVDFDVQIDAQDRLHLGYLRSVDAPGAPAGLYYHQSAPNGNEWLSPVLIYQSPYLRKLTLDDAHVDVEFTNLGDEHHVYLAWDNPPRGRVFLAVSADGGSTWDAPIEVDKPEESKGTASPSKLSVYAQREEVLLLWGAGGPDTACTLYYQQSLDGGSSWLPHQRVPTNLFGCPQEISFMQGTDELFLLLVSNQVYLQAWDSIRWSDPQTQGTLTSFVDTETQQTVHLGCSQAALLNGRSLIFIGCDTSGAGDVWFLRRELDGVDEWFPHESLWVALESVTRNVAQFLSLVMTADANGRVHIFWTQSSDETFSRSDSSLYYTRLEDDLRWAQPVAILTSPEQPVDQPAVALNAADRLLLAWRRGEQGEICFSQVSANLAPLTSAWAEPTRVSAPEHIGSAPDILVSTEGEIYIVYAVSINEGRGIYLTRSEDEGRSWSEPQQIFDGAAAGWSMVDDPRLTISSNGDLHLLFTQYTLLSNRPEPKAMAYTRSQDGGDVWAEPELVVEKPVLWSRILSVGDRTVHRVWEELDAGRSSLRHERSLDSGVSWERVEQIALFGDVMGNPTLSKDLAGRLHLLQFITRGTTVYSLQHWLWDGDRWWRESGLALDLEPDTVIGSLAAEVSPSGKLAVVFSGHLDVQNLSSPENELLFTERMIELPEGPPTPLPPAPLPLVTVAPETTFQPTLELTPETTPTSDLAALSGIEGGGSSGSSWDGLIVGVVLAGTIVAAAFGFGVWKARGGW